MQTRGDLVRPPLEPAEIVPSAQAARYLPSPRAGLAVLAVPAQANAFTPMSLLRALRRRSALALGVALLLTAIAAPSAWILVPFSYKAQARLHVAAQPPKVLFQTVETQSVAGDDYRRYQSTQQALVKSDLVLAAAVRDPKVSGYQMIRAEVDPIIWLQGKLKVDFVAGSELMEISLTGPDPEEVAGIVNAVKRAYIDDVVNVDLKRRTARFDQLNKIKDQYGDLLKKKRETIRKLAESAGSDDRQTLALRQQYAMEHQHYLQKELMDVRSERRRLEARLKLLRHGEAGTPAEPAEPSPEEIDRLVDQSPSVAEVIAELADRQQQFDAARANARRLARNENDPSVQALLATIRDLKKDVDRRRREARPEVMRQARERAADEENSSGESIAESLVMLADLEERLNDEMKSISLVNQKIVVNTLDLQGMQDDVAQVADASAKVAREVEALKIELDAPKRILTIDDATAPRTRDDKKRLILVAMITLGSFFGGLFGVAFLELQSHKVDTAEEVPAELGLPVVGALPILPARNHRAVAVAGGESDKDRYWRNVLLESIDATRTLLLHAARTGSYRVMMITSAVGGEGKTSLASYLATSLGRTGLRTLLIDADLRSPMMHNLFDRPVTPGLSELLRGEVSLDEALGATPVPDLALLTAGRCDRQALRILSQGGVAPLFDRLKQRFEFIIVDTSPVLPVADAMLIAQHVDAALFSIFRDVSRKGKIKAACDRLQRLGVPVLGAVVTGVHGGHYGNEYYDADSASRGLPESVAATPTDPS